MYDENLAHYLGEQGTEQSVEQHLNEVASLTSYFSEKIGMPLLGRVAGLLHDFGKYSEDFQSYIRSEQGKLHPDMDETGNKSLKGKIDHSTAGAQLAWAEFRSRDANFNYIGQVIALCVASHHSGLIDCLSPDGEDKFSNRMAKNVTDSHLDEARQRADRNISDEISLLFNSLQCTDEIKNFIKHLIDDEQSPIIRSFYRGLLVRFLLSALIDADRLSAAGRGENKTPPSDRKAMWRYLADLLERHISQIKPKNNVDKIRSEISEACKQFASRKKGLYRLTVPTGGGKTLSSLRFGINHAQEHGMDRVIYVIPYTSIIDQNAEIARSIFESNVGGDTATVVLEHHSNLTPEEGTWQNQLLSENWDAPIIFTTTVQFLETLFAGGTRGVRRMHRLANAVIIFDEIQALPIKTVHLFNNAINFLVKQCGSTVVLCTATQPLLDRVDVNKGAAKLSIDPEMAPRYDELFKDLKRVVIRDRQKSGGWKEDEVAQLVCEQVQKSNNTLVIVNTKAEARNLYSLLCQRQIGNVFHLSTNMCPAHRMDIINNIKNKLSLNRSGVESVICVSTQLIEAGVDIDFNSVIRYLAGLDSIAQAAGRCNRNGNHIEGEVIIVNPAGEVLSRLPEIEKGKDKTKRILAEYNKNPNAFEYDLLSPHAMEQYYKYYFYERKHEMSYNVDVKDIDRDDCLLSLLSINNLSLNAYERSHNRTHPRYFLRQSFKSAANVFRVIDAPTEGILVPYHKEGEEIIAELCAATGLRETKGLLKRAQRYSVNLFSQQLEILMSKNCIHETQKDSGIYYLDQQYYNEKLGVVFDSQDKMDTLFA